MTSGLYRQQYQLGNPGKSFHSGLYQQQYQWGNPGKPFLLMKMLNEATTIKLIGIA
jgi:hypothetical protein